MLIKCTKFRKDRLVPLHKTAQQAIENYIDYRIEYVSCTESALFISNTGVRPCYSTVVHLFLELMRSIGLRGVPGTSGARIHDLRHTFAVKSLEQCTGEPDEISHHMMALSTYLGHAHISDTYWYLQATPKLLLQISMDQESYYRRGYDD